MNLHSSAVAGPLEFPMPASTQTSSSSNSSTDSSSNVLDSSSNVLDASSFITLLTTELQCQDPTQPISPTDMINQLAELDSLTELAAMRQDLDTLAGTVSQTPTSTLHGVEPSATAYANSFKQHPTQTTKAANSD